MLPTSLPELPEPTRNLNSSAKPECFNPNFLYIYRERERDQVVSLIDWFWPPSCFVIHRFIGLCKFLQGAWRSESDGALRTPDGPKNG